MGLFDTFVIDGNYKNCETIINDWQTKSIGQNLEYFKKDEKIILFSLSISDGTVDVYSYCNECKVFNDAIVYIENGIVSRIELEDKEDLTK